MGKEQECMIIGAAPIKSGKVFKELDQKSRLVICADAGYETALKYGITPDLVVGDFDSAGKRPGEGVKTVTLPVEKDVTDTMYAAMKGLTRGCRSFVLVGCLGGERFDHSIANIEVLHYLMEHGARGYLADETTKIFLIRDGRLRLRGVKGATVSVFPYGCSTCNVTYSGLKYPLTREDLHTGGELMGVSNSVTRADAAVTVHMGTALVVVYQPQ